MESRNFRSYVREAGLRKHDGMRARPALRAGSRFYQNGQFCRRQNTGARIKVLFQTVQHMYAKVFEDS